MKRRPMILLLDFIAGLAGNLIAGWIQQDAWSGVFTLPRLLGTIIGAGAMLFAIGWIENTEPRWLDLIRLWVGRAIQNRVVTHGFFLILGVVFGLLFPKIVRGQEPEKTAPSVETSIVTNTPQPTPTSTITPPPTSTATNTPSPTSTPTSEPTFTATPTTIPTFTVTPTSTPTPTIELYRTYEWQWAGENWYGRLTFEESDGINVISQAKGGLIEKDLDTNQIAINGKVWSLFEGTESTFEIIDGGIAIDLFVEKINRRTNEPVTESITGFLQPTLCFVGTVDYTSFEGGFKGDMILVGDLSSNLGPQVEDWFGDNDNPWVDYATQN